MSEAPDPQEVLAESLAVERLIQAVDAAYQELRDANWVEWMAASALLDLVSQRLFTSVQHDWRVRSSDSVLDSGRGK